MGWGAHGKVRKKAVEGDPMFDFERALGYKFPRGAHAADLEPTDDPPPGAGVGLGEDADEGVESNH